MDLAALIAFIGLIAAQFTAIIAVHAMRRDDEAARAMAARRRGTGSSQPDGQAGTSTVSAPGMTV